MMMVRKEPSCEIKMLEILHGDWVYLSRRRIERVMMMMRGSSSSRLVCIVSIMVVMRPHVA